MKVLPLLTAALIAGAGTIAWAQSPPAASAGPGDGPRRAAFSRTDFDALTDARIAAIQAGLKLNPEQQKLWGPVEQTLRTSSADRAKRIEERRTGADRNQPRPDLMLRLERRAEQATENAQRLTALSNAMKPFWASLDENQKRLLPVLMRPVGMGGRDMAQRRERMRMMEHHGPMDRPRQ
jgi:hypothetical protein